MKLTKRTSTSVNFEKPSVKLKMPSKNRPHRNLSHNKGYVQDLVQSMPYEEKCPTVTGSPDSTEFYKYEEKIENLTIELTTLQLFVKEQFYIIKKQLADMKNIQEPANRKSISSFQEEIVYLRKENHAKT